MNWNAACGIALAAVAVLWAIALKTDLLGLVNVPSLIITIGATFLLLLVTDGGGTFKTHGIGGFAKWLAPSAGVDWSAADHRAAERFANTGSVLAVLSGVVGTLIGLVQMLQALDDPSKVGPALAVAQLTHFYAVGMLAFFFVPMARHHRAAAGRADGSEAGLLDAENPLLVALVVLGGVGLCAGSAFLLVLLAMA